MAVTPVPHTPVNDPIKPNEYNLVIQETQADGIIIDLIMDITGDPLGRIVLLQPATNTVSKWFKIEYGKIVTELPATPPIGNNPPKQHYTNWDYARFVILTNEVCYLVYTDKDNKDSAHRKSNFDGFVMQQGDAIYLEINSAGNYAKVYYV